MNYRDAMPPVLSALIKTPSMLRLRAVGMHCGCQYTDLPTFRGLAPYSRLDHSIGVARIIWDFTRDPVQTAAAALHDAATPAFSHVVDFLNGDHLSQQSTEAGLAERILQDTSLMAVLKKYHIAPEAVWDCSQYPLADCPSPRLCADRLEYTLSNAIHYGFSGDVQPLYDDLTVATNEDGVPELCFSHRQTALQFARLALACGRIYVCDEDRYAMERLSRLLSKALQLHILTPQALYTAEAPVIQALTQSSLAPQWHAFCALHRVFPVDGPGEYAYRIPAKKRYIDPMVAHQGRVSRLFPEFKAQFEEFLSCPQTDYLCGE